MSMLSLAQIRKLLTVIEGLQGAAKARANGTANAAEEANAIRNASRWQGEAGTAANNALKRTVQGFDHSTKNDQALVAALDGEHATVQGLIDRINALRQEAESYNPPFKVDENDDSGLPICPPDTKNLTADQRKAVIEKNAELTEKATHLIAEGKAADGSVAKTIVSSTGGDAGVHVETKGSQADGKTKPADSNVLPEQKLAGGDKSIGTPQGQDMFKKNPDGTVPAGLAKMGRGEDVKVDKPSGPIIAKGGTPDQGKTFILTEDKGNGPFGTTWKSTSKVGETGATANYEIRKDGIVSKVNIEADASAHETIVEKHLGPFDFKTGYTTEVGTNATAEANLKTSAFGADVPHSGFQIGADGMAGAKGGLSEEVSTPWGFGLKHKDDLGVGVGGAAQLNAGWQGDEFKVGWQIGGTVGAGAKDSWEISVNPHKVGDSLSRLAQWALN